MDYAVEFDGLKLREVGEADYERVEEWIAADPEHAALFEPDFFLGREVNKKGEVAPDPRATCYALEDEHGPIFFVRLSRAARVHIQFPPTANAKGQASRTALALVRGMAFLEAGLSRAGASEWIFSTESSRLEKLARRSLGFERSPTEMVRAITRMEDQGKTLHGVQQVPETEGEDVRRA